MAGLVEPGRQRHPGAVDAFADRHRRLLRGGAGAALLRPGPGGGADDAEASAGERRLEHHPRDGRRRRPGRSAAAWRRCARRGRRRRARSRRRRGRSSCPAPVAPESRNSPAALSASKSTVAVSANGPNAVTSSRCSLISRPPATDSRRVDVGVVAAGVAGVLEQRGLGSVAAVAAQLADEVEGDRVVGPRAGPRGRHAGGVAAVGLEREHQGVREPAAQPLHRLRRADGVGEGGLHPARLVGRQRGVGEQVVEGAPQPRQRPRDGRLDERRGDPSVAVEVDQPRTLGLGVLGEGVGERGPAVAHPVGQRLGAVEVAEGDVVDPVEQPGRHPGHPADADVALGLAGLAAGHEGVRQHHRPRAGGAGGEVAAYAVAWPRTARPRGSARAAPRARPAPAGRGRGGRRRPPGRARRPARRGCRRSAASVRMKTPAASISRELNPSRCAESWLPLVSTTRARERASRASDSSASRTASTGGSARS